MIGVHSASLFTYLNSVREEKSLSMTLMKMILLCFSLRIAVMRFSIQRSSHCHRAEGEKKRIEGLEENYS